MSGGSASAESVRELIGAERAILFRVVPSSGTLESVAISGHMGPAFGSTVTLPPGAGVSGLAAREGRPVATPDALGDGTLARTVRAVLDGR